MQNQIQVHNDDASELEEEVEKLEEMVNEMAGKVLEYRNTLCNELTNTLASLLPSRFSKTHFSPPNPLPLPTRIPTRTLLSTQQPPRHDESGNDPCLARDKQEDAEKLQLLKQKISNNAFTIPVVLEKMKECIARINKLESYGGVIRPAFKMRRPS